jgi:hypothetical protein
MIIPVYHIVSSVLPIQSSTTLEAGHVVGLDSDGYCVKAYGSAATIYCIGLAGDRNRASESYEWVNRVSDSGNDTAASGMLTVYHSGGEFYVDVNDSRITTPNGTAIEGIVSAGTTTTPGTILYVENAIGNRGRLTSTSTSAQTVAVALEAAAELSSGIPGEYEPGSSVDYVNDDNARQYVKIKLLI